MKMFSKKICGTGIAAALLVLGIAPAVTGEEDKPRKTEPIVGRWDMTMRSPEGEDPSWLEVRRSGHRTLVGSFVGQFGSARPIARVEFENGSFSFSIPPQWEERKDDLHFAGRLEGEMLRGSTTDEKGRPVTWTAQR